MKTYNSLENALQGAVSIIIGDCTYHVDCYEIGEGMLYLSDNRGDDYTYTLEELNSENIRLFELVEMGVINNEEAKQAIIDHYSSDEDIIPLDSDIYSTWCENSLTIPSLALLYGISEKVADRIVNAGLELDNKATF